uniref:Uncharacterized protein n=1 Tax=Rhizophora mucronata TaxID=61149 RepID=A0A2P2P2H9_RHIMU
MHKSQTVIIHTRKDTLNSRWLDFSIFYFILSKFSVKCLKRL